MAEPDLGFSYRFQPAGPDVVSPAPAVLLLQEGGGNEDDELPLVDVAGSAAAVLRPQGKVDEGGLARYFRRLDSGAIDVEDLHRRVDELSRFVAGACEAFDLDPGAVWALGFSGAAVTAAALALDHPDTLAGGVLLSGAAPFPESEGKRLAGKVFFCAHGRADPVVSLDQYEELVELLVTEGAEVELHWYEAGHEVSPEEVADAGAWLRRRLGRLAD
ncbi:MAG TPA: dienelactone hydrolase family protein [Acidimicrobiales bacterium]|nr:dienelactone hydrolase family protein [Acidimicrobiales bacterium]